MNKKPSEKPGEKYLQNKIGLVHAAVTGHSIGISLVAKTNPEFHYNYDSGEKLRNLIEKDMRQLFRYAYNLGKKSK